MAQLTWKQVDPTAPKRPRAPKRSNLPVHDTNTDVSHNTDVNLFSCVPPVEDQPVHGQQSGNISVPEHADTCSRILPLEEDVHESASTSDTDTSSVSHLDLMQEVHRPGDSDEDSAGLTLSQTTLPSEEGDTIAATPNGHQNSEPVKVNSNMVASEPFGLAGDDGPETSLQTDESGPPSRMSPAATAQTYVLSPDLYTQANLRSETTMDTQSSKPSLSSMLPTVPKDLIGSPAHSTATPPATPSPSPLYSTGQELRTDSADHGLKRPSDISNDTHCRKKRLMSEMKPIVTRQGDDCWDDDVPELFNRLDAMSNSGKVRVLLSILKGFLGSTTEETSASFNALPRCVRAEILIRLLVGLGDEDELSSETPCVPKWITNELRKGRSAGEAIQMRFNHNL